MAGKKLYHLSYGSPGGNVHLLCAANSWEEFEDLTMLRDRLCYREILSEGKRLGLKREPACYRHGIKVVLKKAQLGEQFIISIPCYPRCGATVTVHDLGAALLHTLEEIGLLNITLMEEANDS